ncbi:MAG: pentapeptide repeat-containing protein [Spirochaetales bacterium]|nr:pentapeptide repeat-containing protein [Spirochaetales bacterium]MBP7263414.1 pentapeptide repeat-containing protein [Spirochaetia bacterium]
MYSFKRCSAPGCEATVLSGSEFCASHHPDPKAYAEDTLTRLAGTHTIKNENLSGLMLEGADLSGKRFYACSFARSALKNVTFAGSLFRMCFFDFCQADSCDFSGVDAQFCSFAGARLFNASFENSELIHNNFNGLAAESCTFSFSNLYNSRFMMANFRSTDFVDCNLKNAWLIDTVENEVSWKYSNLQEAVRSMEDAE